MCTYTDDVIVCVCACIYLCVVIDVLKESAVYRTPCHRQDRGRAVRLVSTGRSRFPAPHHPSLSLEHTNAENHSHHSMLTQSATNASAGGLGGLWSHAVINQSNLSSIYIDVETITHCCGMCSCPSCGVLVVFSVHLGLLVNSKQLRGDRKEEDGENDHKKVINDSGKAVSILEYKGCFKASTLLWWLTFTSSFEGRRHCIRWKKYKIIGGAGFCGSLCVQWGVWRQAGPPYLRCLSWK